MYQHLMSASTALLICGIVAACAHLGGWVNLAPYLPF